jgi:hypothetical protein
MYDEKTQAATVECGGITGETCVEETKFGGWRVYHECRVCTRVIGELVSHIGERKRECGFEILGDDEIGETFGGILAVRGT